MVRRLFIHRAEARMNPWLVFVDAVRVALFATAHVVGGSMGAGILAFTVAVRVALLPVTIPAAKRMRAQQAKLRQLKPQLQALARRFKGNPARLQEATAALYRENGLSMAGPGLSSAFVQWPIGGAIFSSLRDGLARNTRFLWIRDLTRPDLGVALVAATIAAVAARFSGGESPRAAMVIGATLTFLFAWRMSASVALYTVAWNGVSAAESLVLSIAERRRGA
jgi:YidC/Oxa1 family membrane protein insertase